MAKTIMIANGVYARLRTVKGDRSFSEVLDALLNPAARPRGKDLRKCLGTLKDDEEWRRAQAILDRGWKRWNTRSA